MYQYNDELYHHGVKGMRWGVLRSRTAVLYDKNPGHKAESKNPSSKNTYEGEVYKAKQAYKQAKKDYKESNKDLSNKMNAVMKNSYRHPITQYVTQKGRAKKDQLGKELVKSAETANSKYSAMKAAKKNIKVVKKADKDAKRDTARARKVSKKNGSDSTRAKINRSNNKKSKVSAFLEKQAKKNVSRSLNFQRKHKIGAYGKVSAAYHKKMGHTYRDPKTGKIVRPNK